MAPRCSLALSLGVLLLAARRALGIDNGLGITPPQAWRSWNAYDCTSPEHIITQAHVEAQFAAAVDRSRLVDGKNMSLADLGFDYISIDDGRVLRARFERCQPRAARAARALADARDPPFLT